MCLHLLIVVCCLLYSVVSGLKNSHPCYAMFGCIQKIEGKGKERHSPFLCLVLWLVERGKEQRREVCLFTFGSGREKKGGSTILLDFAFMPLKEKNVVVNKEL